MDDQDLDLSLEDDQPQINKTQERIKSLNSKVGEANRGKEEAEQRAAEATKRAEKAEKKAEFISSFSEVSQKYQGATEYKDQIQEKVDIGYTVEDATVAILNAEGKLLPQEPIFEAPLPAAGGSAPTTLPSQAPTAGEMTQEERRAELLKPERASDIERILRQGI